MGGLTPIYSLTDVFRRIEKFADERINQSVLSLSYVGENFINHAREHGSYTDHTGNLRSSIGYIVLLNGKIERKKIEKAGVGSDQSTGTSRARELAADFAQEFSNDLVLICFAGMEYAAAVESLGYDVITGSVPIAESLLRELKRDLT